MEELKDCGIKQSIIHYVHKLQSKCQARLNEERTKSTMANFKHFCTYIISFVYYKQSLNRVKTEHVNKST